MRKKGPPNLPARQDHVRLRGRADHGTGTLTKMNDETNWCTVEWDDHTGPEINHLFELEKV